jgi:hypothetical protein
MAFAADRQVKVNPTSIFDKAIRVLRGAHSRAFILGSPYSPRLLVIASRLETAMCERCEAWEKVIDNFFGESLRREEIGQIITEKEALASGGLISDAMMMDERFAYVGKEVYIIKNDIKKLREDLR